MESWKEMERPQCILITAYFSILTASPTTCIFGYLSFCCFGFALATILTLTLTLITVIATIIIIAIPITLTMAAIATIRITIHAIAVTLDLSQYPFCSQSHFPIFLDAL